MADEIVLVAYNQDWPAEFRAEAARIEAAVGGGLITRIEHFGSTAVPGMSAKPIIDILVGVHSLERAKQDAVPALEAIGYSYWRDNPRPGHLYFVKGLPPNGPRTHHIHMVEPESELWDRLLFRDYLRTYPEEAQRYAALKQTLAAQFSDDREAYTDSKTEYVQSVMEKARREITK